MADDVEVLQLMAADNHGVAIVESTKATMDEVDSTSQESSQPPPSTDDSHLNSAIGLEIPPRLDNVCDVREAIQPSSTVLQVEDGVDDFSQVVELVQELMDIGCRNAEGSLIAESASNSVVAANHNSFALQRNYIPEHLLPSSDSSGSDGSSSDEDDSSDSSSSDSSGDDSDDSDDSSLEADQRGGRRSGINHRRPIRTLGELGLEDLPPIHDLKISVNRSDVKHVGCVLSIVECLVVVQSLPNMPALNLDTVLFFEGGEPLGQIFDVFGPVIRPLYSVRFNTTEDIKTKNVVVGSSIYYAPTKTEFTTFVFAEQLRRMKGSDASWQNNNEPPEKFLDYSDDEQERLAKARRRNRHRENDEDGGSASDDGHDVEHGSAAEKLPTKRQIAHRSHRGRGRRGSHHSSIPEAAAPSAVAQVRPDQYWPNIRPPSMYGHYRPDRPFRPPIISNERPQNPFYDPRGPAILPHPMFTGQFSRPPPSLLRQQWPQMRPWRSPAAAPHLNPIASLFRSQTQVGSAESSDSASGNVNSSPSSAGNVLPNPFRNPGNVSDLGSRGVAEADDETGMTPRFPPLGFVPRF